MSRIYITSEAETLAQVLASVYDAKESQDQEQRKALLLDANPQLSSNSPLNPYTFLFIPQVKEELACSVAREKARATWSSLDSKTREVAFESNSRTVN